MLKNFFVIRRIVISFRHLISTPKGALAGNMLAGGTLFGIGDGNNIYLYIYKIKSCFRQNHRVKVIF